LAQYVENCKIVGQRKVASSSGAAGDRSTNQISIQIGLFPVSLQIFPPQFPYSNDFPALAFPDLFFNNKKTLTWDFRFFPNTEEQL